MEDRGYLRHASLGGKVDPNLAKETRTTPLLTVLVTAATVQRTTLT